MSLWTFRIRWTNDQKCECWKGGEESDSKRNIEKESTERASVCNTHSIEHQSLLMNDMSVRRAREQWT